MANVVLLAQIVKGFNEGGAIVHDDLTKSAQPLLLNKGPQSKTCG